MPDYPETFLWKAATLGGLHSYVKGSDVEHFYGGLMDHIFSLVGKVLSDFFL